MLIGVQPVFKGIFNKKYKNMKISTYRSRKILETKQLVLKYHRAGHSTRTIAIMLKNYNKFVRSHEWVRSVIKEKNDKNI